MRLIQVSNVDLAESRAVDLGNEFLHILASTQEPNGCESRKQGLCRERWAYLARHWMEIMLLLLTKP